MCDSASWVEGMKMCDSASWVEGRKMVIQLVGLKEDV